MTMNICICMTCAPAASVTVSKLRLMAAISAAGLTDIVSVSTAACLGACQTPSSVALQGQGRASYLFSGISFDTDIDDLIATCCTYLKAPGGWIEDARPCGRLRSCLRARIPALPEQEG